VKKIHLVLLIHAHQPVGNFDVVLEKIYQQSYLPFVEHLTRHPSVRLGLHYSGPLLEWLEARHPEFIAQLIQLASRKQVEMIGGGYYEPILISIPRRDQLAQLRLMRDWLAEKFGAAPRGAWLAERVWEPDLPTSLEAAKVEYTLLDDVHFQAAGIELEDLFGYYIAEDRGAKVKVIPGSKALRYIIPFHDVPEIIDFLRGAAERHPDGMAAMGDDCEKFGGWPGTYVHCYQNGWLERFFAALEENSEWLATTPPGEYLAHHAPIGPAALPTAAYTEMMEWVLPLRARRQLTSLEGEFSGRPDVLRFLRGGIWRGFFCKYPEVNLLHKKMLRVSKKVGGRRASGGNSAAARKLAGARTSLLRAQCNDAYWHGVFGGLYAPHLRTELWRELIRAESAVDSFAARRSAEPRLERIDFDADGAEEIYVTAPKFSALIKPDDGATIAALDFRPSAVAVINSLQRRPETYHARLAEVAASSGGVVASIHNQTRVKEAGLEKKLRYDRWPRHAFRTLLFSSGKSRGDYAAISLEESAAFAAGRYDEQKFAAGAVIFAMDSLLELPGVESRPIHVEKEMQFRPNDDGGSVRCVLRARLLDSQSSVAVKFQAGMELVINFLVPNEPDRYFDLGAKHGATRQPLNWEGETSSQFLRVVDEWQNISAAIEAPGASATWICPIETVSESEEGFERVYQGSQILPVWQVELRAGKEWSAELTLNLSQAHA
jgi:4-alpha-glucanotransferase